QLCTVTPLIVRLPGEVSMLVRLLSLRLIEATSNEGVCARGVCDRREIQTINQQERISFRIGSLLSSISGYMTAGLHLKFKSDRISWSRRQYAFWQTRLLA